MDTLSLVQASLEKYQDLWDRIEDLLTEMEELKQSTSDALDDLNTELMELRLETGGWLKVLESNS